MNNLYQKNSNQDRLFGLDLIRAVAICLVLLSHLAKTVDIFGFIGVELFFGLSGYLIGNILWRSFFNAFEWSTENIVNFWARRWWRTLPSYYLFLLVCIALAGTTSETLPPSSELARFIWFGQSLTKHYNWFYGVSWSLCIEEWFYLSFPILLLIISAFITNKRAIYVTAIIITFIISFINKIILYNKGVEDSLRLITVARLDAIASGVLIAYLEKNINSPILYRKILPAAGSLSLVVLLSIIVINRLSVKDIESNPYLLTLFPFFFSLALPFLSSIKKPQYLKPVILFSIQNISLWSYSIYLSHMAILSSIYFIQDTFIGSEVRATTIGNIITKMTGITLILIISSFLYKHFELPFTRRRPPELDYSKRQANIS